MRKLLFLAAAAAGAYAVSQMMQSRQQARPGAGRRERAAPRQTTARQVAECIGRAISNPDTVRARVRDGVVSLRGEAPRREVEQLLTLVLAVPGVDAVSNYVEFVESPVLDLPAEAAPAETGRPRRALQDGSATL